MSEKDISSSENRSISSPSRRSVLALAGTGAVALLAGCSDSDGSGDNGGGSGGSGGISASLDATSDNPEDHFSDTFAASEGEEFEVTIEAGSDGADVSLMPEEGETGMSGDDPVDEGPEDIGFPWFLDPDEELTDTVEIRRDEGHLFWITAGQADVEAQQL